MHDKRRRTTEQVVDEDCKTVAGNTAEVGWMAATEEAMVAVLTG